MPAQAAAPSALRKSFSTLYSDEKYARSLALGKRTVSHHVIQVRPTVNPRGGKRAKQERKAFDNLFHRGMWWALNNRMWPGRAMTVEQREIHYEMTISGRREYWREQIVAENLKRPFCKARLNALMKLRDNDLASATIV